MVDYVVLNGAPDPVSPILKTALQTWVLPERLDSKPVHIFRMR